jgi:hypothetical protein
LWSSPEKLTVSVLGVASMSLMKSARQSLALLGISLMLSAAAPASAQQRPLLTEDVEIIPPGKVRLQFGFEFLQRQLFALSGLRGDFSRLGVVGVNFGLAPNVQVEVRGTIQNYLSIDRMGPSAVPLRLRAANTTNDIGDFSFFTKVLLRRESRRLPAVGLRFGVELPNSDQSRGIGVNQTNYFGTMLLGKHVGRLNLFGHLGLGILSVPLERFAQNDVLLYGVAGIYPVNDRLNVVGEVSGRSDTRRGAAPLGTESLGQARFGIQLLVGGLRWDVAGVRGLTDFSPRTGVVFGMTYDFPGLRPVR